MSSHLTVEPMQRNKLRLGTSLKLALRKKYGEPVNVVMNNANGHFTEFLSGLIIASDCQPELAKDAKMLLDFLEKHDELSIKEEY